MAQQPPYSPPGQQPQQQQWRQPPPAKKTSGCLIALIVAVAVGVPMLGVMAALGIYGVRRYLVAAKTVEAKNTVAAISRNVVSAYERETVNPGPHRLCTSAIPVPAAVPMAKKYLPSSAAGEDFNSGSATAGWTCLRFAMATPMYYQYQYHQGSGWIVPSLAPGADGFEVVAQGDLDGNGVTSKFARVGKVTNGKVTLSQDLYIENEFE